jgi:hypothetical protein
LTTGRPAGLLETVTQAIGIEPGGVLTMPWRFEIN